MTKRINVDDKRLTEVEWKSGADLRVIELEADTRAGSASQQVFDFLLDAGRQEQVCLRVIRAKI